jgi:hypothetical protein
VAKYVEVEGDGWLSRWRWVVKLGEMGGQVGGDGWLSWGRWVTKFGRWVAKLVARLLAMADLWVRIQTSFKNTKWATQTKEWPAHSSPPKMQKITSNQ